MFFSRAFCLLLVFLCMNAYSQSRLDSIQHLQEVEVVANANKYKEVIPSQKLTGIQIEALNSFSVSDAIRYFSGVQIKDYGGIGGLKTVNIRSMGTNHMGVFYDGIQLGNAQNGQIDLGKFSLDNVDEISLYNGQKSEIFQSAKDFSASGTIYLRTRHPRFEESKKTNLKAFFRTGSFNLINPSLLWEQEIKDNISSSINAEYISSSGKYKYRMRTEDKGTLNYDSTAVRQNGDIQSFRIESGLNGFFDSGKWNVKIYYYDSERGIPGAVIENKPERTERQWDKNFFTQGSFQKQFNNRFESLFNAKYAYDYMRYYSPDTISPFIDNTFKQQEVYISTANKFSVFPTLDIALSIDYQWNILDANLQDFVFPKRHTLLIAFASAFEYQKVKAQGSVLGTFVFENVTRIQHKEGSQLLESAQTGTPLNKQEITPAIFLSYKPFFKYPFTLYAFYKHIFRMPTFNDLYYTNIGNITLEPEYTVQYNIGFVYNKDFNEIFTDFSLKTDVYYNEVTNKIIATPTSSTQYRWTMINLGKVEITGMDISSQLTCRLPYNLNVNFHISYTYQKALDFSEPDPTLPPEADPYGGQIPYIPLHSGSFILRAMYKTWDLNYSFIYTGERHSRSSNITEYYEKPWYTHDITLGKVFTFKKNRFKVSAEINNLLNQQYDVVENYPMPGRNYKLILKIDI